MAQSTSMLDGLSIPFSGSTRIPRRYITLEYASLAFQSLSRVPHALARAFVDAEASFNPFLGFHKKLPFISLTVSHVGTMM